MEFVQDSFQNLKMAARFFGKFLRHPTKVASIVPSSNTLAQAIIQDISITEGDRVVEYGPGTGSFTVALKAKFPPGVRYLGIEQDNDFFELLNERFPDLKFHQGSAENVLKILETHQMGKAKAIVSGLPFVLMEPDVVSHILQSTHDALMPNGVFLTFTYVHGSWMGGAKHLRNMLRKYFGHVEMNRVVWRNLPPAIIILARPKA